MTRKLLWGGGIAIALLITAGVFLAADAEAQGNGQWMPLKLLMRNGARNVKTDATLLIDSNTADGTTSATVAAVTLASTVNVTDGDLVLNVENSAGDNLLTVDEQGLLTALTDIKAAGNDYICSGTGATCTITSDANDTTVSSTVAALTFKATVNVTDGDLLAAFHDSAGTAVLKVDEQGALTSASTKTRGSCTLNGASPSVCTATVLASANCTCSPVGATAAIAAAGCAVGLSGTTLTITSANAATNDVNYHCL